MIKTIDLFAGCGGFSYGFERAGFKIILAVEFDKTIAESYKANHKNVNVIVNDIKKVDNSKIFKNVDAQVIIGGPPCQGFSMAGARIRKGFIDDPRNYLFKHYFNVVKLVKPKIFILENVKGILNLKKGQIFREIESVFKNPDNFNGKPYKIQYKVVKVKQFGVPQNRERVIIIGSQFDFNLEKEIKNTKQEILKIDKYFFDKVTVWDAISNLPNPTESGNVKVLKFDSQYQKSLKSNSKIVKNHYKTNHSQKTIDRIKKIKIDENFKTLEEKINSIHSGSYGRLNPNGIAPTITTRFDSPSGGKFTHPFKNRTLTAREAARIQSFPDDFTFTGTKSSVCKQIGNAVPPKVAYFFAVMIRRLLNEN